MYHIFFIITVSWVYRELLTSNSGGEYPAPDETVSELKIQLLTNQAKKDYVIRLKGKSDYFRQPIQIPNIQMLLQNQIISKTSSIIGSIR